MIQIEETYEQKMKKYYRELIRYWLFMILTPASLILVGIFLIKDLTFFITCALIINTLRAYMEDSYHCDKLWHCFILTNILFLIGGIISPLLSPYLAFYGSILLAMYLYHDYDSKPLNVILGAIAIGLVVGMTLGLNVFLGSIFISLLYVIILRKSVDS